MVKLQRLRQQQRQAILENIAAAAAARVLGAVRAARDRTSAPVSALRA